MDLFIYITLLLNLFPVPIYVLHFIIVVSSEVHWLLDSLNSCLFYPRTRDKQKSRSNLHTGNPYLWTEDHCEKMPNKRLLAFFFNIFARVLGYIILRSRLYTAHDAYTSSSSYAYELNYLFGNLRVVIYYFDKVSFGFK